MSWDSQKEAFVQFSKRVEARMEAGSKEYGDGSFSREPTELISEISEELEDIMGWTFILWTRLQGLSKRLEKTDGEV